MDTMGQRLKYAREKAGIPSAMAAAKRFGWTPSTYAAHENGQNEFSVERAERYARAFKVSAGWLLSGQGEIGTKNSVTVEGLVSAGGAIETRFENIGHEGLEEIEVPVPLPLNAAGFRVAGDSMFPRYDDGDVIIVIRRERPPEELLFSEALITTADGNRYLKRIVSSSRKGYFDLESFNAPPIRNVKIRTAEEVEIVIRRGQWKTLDSAGKRRLVRQKLRKGQL